MTMYGGVWVILFLISMKSWCGMMQDLDNIWNHYVSACGFKLCDTSNMSLSYTHSSLMHLDSICPPCSCDGCTLNRNCCPDLELKFLDTTCQSNVAYSAAHIQADFYFTAFDSCPMFAEKNVAHLCQNSSDLIDKFTLPPVTTSSGKTYKNSYCAECNGVKDFKEWAVDIKCEKLVDFNFLSSFKEIENTIESAKCIIKYNSYDIPYPIHRCEIPISDYIDKCNETGTWASYDQDLDWACNQFHLPFQVYKNVFCYMCNPPRPENNQVISKCNETGKWIDNGQNLVEACHRFTQSSVTHPFKNIFCYYCNENYSFQMYDDIFGVFTTSFSRVMDTFYYTMNSDTFTNEFLGEITNLQGKPLSNKRLTSSFILNENGQVVDMFHLMTKYRYVYGNNLCGVYGAENASSSALPDKCSCFYGCVADRACCIDRELDLNLTCINNRVISNTCRYDDVRFDKECHKRGDLIHDIPVYIEMTRDHYSNLFCALCSSDFFNYLSVELREVKPWNIKITCLKQNSLHVFYQSSVGAVLNLARQRNCTVEFEAKTQEVECEATSNTIDRCNITGTWIVEDKNLLWACERLDSYVSTFHNFRNVFCSLCNPGVPVEPITTIVPTYPPPTTNNPITPPCSICLTDKTVVIYRRLFQISHDNDDIIRKCDPYQFLDELQNKCRNITCPPGYVIGNSSCEPLLVQTDNLGYIIPLRIETINLVNLVENPNLLENLDRPLRAFFKSYLNLFYNVEFLSFYITANGSCKRNESLKIEFLASLELFIEERVKRKEIETKLVNLIDEIINLVDEDDYKDQMKGQLHDGDLRVRVSLDQRGLDTRVIIDNKAKFTGDCYSSKIQCYSHIKEVYRFNPVSELLTCEQVFLEKEDITIDESTSFIKFKTNQVEVKKGNFRFDKDDKVRICINTLKSLTGYKSSNDPTINLLMIVTTALSMLCLLITFITYCIFPSLRSVPGRNNMALVASIFFLQASLLISVNVSSTVVACKVFGITLHYFLLSTFTGLNICTFHMYKAFGSIKVQHTTEHDNRTVLYYCLYTFGVPAIIIAINITITMYMSHDIGYGNSIDVCFLVHRYAVIGTVIVPLSLICISNIMFFSLTLRMINAIPKIERSSSHNAAHQNSVIYIKLFSLTGITWLLQIIDALLPITYLSVLTAVFNSLQGVYIFLSYICNSRVFQLYKGCFKCCSERTELSSSGATASTKIQSTSTRPEHKYIAQ